MSERNFAADYIQVNERIIAFKDRYPEGSLQSELLRFDESMVVFKAYAYRTPDDPRPGIGHSALAIPGKTPYTRDSELENCETSAFGRALAALGFEVKRGIATNEEVANRRPAKPRREFDEEAALRTEVQDAALKRGLSTAALSLMADRVGIPKGTRANVEQLREMLLLIEQPGSGVPIEQPEQAATPTPATGFVSGPPPPPSGLAPAQAPIDAPDVALTAPVEAVQPEAGPPSSAAPTTLELLRAEPSEFTFLAHLSATVYDGAPVSLDDVVEADVAQAVAAIGDDTWKELYGRFPAPLRARIKGLGHAPTDRVKRVAERPDAEQIKAGMA